METITKDIKAKYYAQYWDLNIAFGGDNTDGDTIGYMMLDLQENKYSDNTFEYWKVYLTPIEQISDEDAIWFCKTNNFNYDNSLLDSKSSYDLEELRNDINHLMNDLDFPIKTYQYLQSKGYALPYLDYSVSDLVELNVIKLKK